MTEIKGFYTNHADMITDKRARSPYPLRRYVHGAQYDAVLAYVEPGMRVLDAGCGEGTLSVMMAKKGAIVTGVDISAPNIIACQRYAREAGVEGVSFCTGDLENLAFPDDAFDLVVSSHVLEHLPNFDTGLVELMRVSKKRVVAAIPTALSVCSWVQVGHGWFYLKGLRSFFALPWGMLRTLFALVSGSEGVDETYGGADVPHVFRFPWVMKHTVRRLGFRLVEYQADSLCVPYANSLVPFLTWLNKYRRSTFLRDCGYGTLYVIEK